MPLFFAVSSLFLKPMSLAFLRQRVQRILVPYFFFCLAGVPTIKQVFFASWVNWLSLQWRLPCQPVLLSLDVHGPGSVLAQSEKARSVSKWLSRLNDGWFGGFIIVWLLHVFANDSLDRTFVAWRMSAFAN